MNREDIVRRYRDRIAAGARTRLTGEELSGLVRCFIDRLKPLDDRAQIDRLCADEIALLESGYPEATVAKNYIPQYRKAILAATDDGSLPLTKNTLLDYDYTKRNGEVVHFHGHYAYTVMKYTEEYTKIADEDNTRNNQKQDSLKAVNWERYLEAAQKLLASGNHNDLAAGIAAVTGRRFSEVIQNQFSQTEDPYTLKFAGQLKKRGETEAYHTLCLMPAAEVWSAIERFRQSERIRELQQLTPHQINSRMNKAVQRHTHWHFGQTGIVPTLEGEKATTVHNLRSVYAIAAIHLFCPPSKGDHRFLQEQLGHVIGQSNLEKLKNSPSTAHYFHYYLTDDRGQHLGSKGVLLDERALMATQCALDFDRPSTTIVPSESQSVSQPAIEPAVEPTDAIATQTKPEQLPAPPTATTPETKFLEVLSELSNTNGFLRREAEEQKQRAEALQSERERLALEVETLRQRVSDLECSVNQRAAEVEPWRQQIQTLQAENDSYKAKLEAFGRLLANDTNPSATPARELPTPTAPAPPQPASSSDRSPPEAVASPAPPSAHPKSPTKRLPGRQSARGKLEGAVQFLQELNHQSDRGQQWGITQSLIAALTGSNIKFTVKPFWQEIESDMTQYHSEREIDPQKQNYGRSSELSQLKTDFHTWLDRRSQG